MNIPPMGETSFRFSTSAHCTRLPFLSYLWTKTTPICRWWLPCMEEATAWFPQEAILWKSSLEANAESHIAECRQSADHLSEVISKSLNTDEWMGWRWGWGHGVRITVVYKYPLALICHEWYKSDALFLDRECAQDHGGGSALLNILDDTS